MTKPVTYVEMHSPDLEASIRFFIEAFGWDPQPFASPDYFVSPAGSAHGIDAGLLRSMDGSPRTVSVINVPSLDDATKQVVACGGRIVVEPFTIPGVGRGCYFTDPSGLLIGLHENNPEA